MKAPFKRHRRKLGLFAGMAVTAVTLVFVLGTSAASLPGSIFEIDGPPSGSNFVVNTPGNLDWANVANLVQQDRPTGQNDDSYQGGVKEDTVCPGEVTGSIPNNKSDLKTYLAYQETEANGPGFLNLGWIRVNNPSGTTLMDFELNHSSTPCASGPNVLRTPGDLLIEYAIDQGGAVASIDAREWSGSAWGAATPLPSQAIGTINLVTIPANQTDGNSLTPLAPRTFGEMSLDLDFIFEAGRCESFGSTQLKSRSSDAFNSQLKDFIRPIPINLTNCGNVIIRKQTDPQGDTTLFDYTKSFPTDPASSNTFQLADDGVKDYNDSVLVGTGYTVHEDDLPANWEFVSLDCSASTGTTPVVVGRTATFDIGVGDTADCTYTNRLHMGAILVTKTRKHAADGPGDHPHAGVDFTVDGVTQTTDANGQACFDGLAFGDYVVHEDVPLGYHVSANDQTVTVDNNATCLDSPYGGEEVAFHNTPLTDLTISLNSQVPGGTASSWTCDNGGPNGSTGADGDGSSTALNLEPVEIHCTIIIDP